MNRLTGLAAALVATSLLGGCASNTAAPAPKPVARAGVAGPDGVVPGRPKSAAKAAAGYRMVTRNGQELYCKRELLTGSRTNAPETCLTAEQLEKQRNEMSTTVRTLQDMNNGKPADGAYNTVMGQGRRD